MSDLSGGINHNPDDIAPGDAINFPYPLVNPYGNIQRVAGSNTLFLLQPNSVYEIIFQVVISNTGELVLVLNDTEQLFTVVGKSGGGPVIGTCIISTPSTGASIISINNPASALGSGLQVDSATGVLSEPLSCHLIIKQLR
jgi:hypothetical protein